MRRLIRVLAHPFVFIAVIAATAVPATAATTSRTSSACTAEQFVGARGSSEPQGLGNTLGPVYSAFRANAKPSISGRALTYPAVTLPLPGESSTWTQFFGSVDTGVANFKQYMVAQAAKCPAQHYVIAGYSQGAMVVDQTLFALPANVLSRVDGVALFGDPRLTNDFNHNLGSPDPDLRGAARTLNPSLWWSDYVPPAMNDKTRSYCIAGDPACNFSITNLWSCEQNPEADCPHTKYASSGLARTGGLFLANRTNARISPSVL